MNNVKLTISGAAKTGKTTLLRFVVRKMREAGCEVRAPHDERPPKHDASFLKALKVDVSEERRGHGGKEPPDQAVHST